MIKGDFVSPAPLRAPPRENSIPMSGCKRAKIHKNTTVNLITSESSMKNPETGLENIAITNPTIVIENTVNLADFQPLLLASLGFSAPRYCPVKVAPAMEKP